MERGASPPRILPPGLLSCLKAGSPGPSGPSVLAPSAVAEGGGPRSSLFHAEPGCAGREGIKKRLWLRFPELMVSVCCGYLHCKRKQTAKSRDESKQPKWSRNILAVGVKLTFSQQQRSTLCGPTGKMNRWREAPRSDFLSGTHRRREAFPKVHAVCCPQK